MIGTLLTTISHLFLTTIYWNGWNKIAGFFLQNKQKKVVLHNINCRNLFSSLDFWLDVNSWVTSVTNLKQETYVNI